MTGAREFNEFVFTRRAALAFIAAQGLEGAEAEHEIATALDAMHQAHLCLGRDPERIREMVYAEMANQQRRMRNEQN
jgi:hypothetical protein